MRPEAGAVRGQTAPAPSETYIEPAHDALIQNWRNVHTWRREAEAGATNRLQLRQSVVEAARDRRRGDGGLWVFQRRLDAAATELNHDPFWLSQGERRFVADSLRAQAALCAVALVLAMILSIGGYRVAVGLRDARQVQARNTYLSALAASRQPDGQREAVALGLSSLNTFPTPEARQLLSQELSLLPPLRGENKAGKGRVNALVVTLDGKVLASACADGTVQLWKLPECTPLAPALVHKEGVLVVRLSADLRRVATISGNGRITVWESGGSDGAYTARVIEESEALATDLAFSPDARYLAVGGKCEKGVSALRVYDLNGNGTPIQLLSQNLPQEEWVRRVFFDRTGRRLVSAPMYGTARVWSEWNTASPHASALAKGWGTADTDPDLQYLVVNGGPDGVKVIPVSETKQALLMRHPWMFVTGVALGGMGLSSGGPFVAFTANNGQEDRFGAGLYLWDVGSAREGDRIVENLPVDKIGWNALVFSHDPADKTGMVLTTGRQDGTARIYRLQYSQALRVRLQEVARLPHPAAVTAVCPIPGSSLVATGTEDGRIRLWRLDDALRPARLYLQNRIIHSIAFDGERSLLSTDDRLAVWVPSTNLLSWATLKDRRITGRLIMSPNGEWAVGGIADTLAFYHFAPSTSAREKAQGEASLLPLGSLGVASGDKEATILDIPPAFSPDNRFLAAAPRRGPGGRRILFLFSLAQNPPVLIAQRDLITQRDVTKSLARLVVSPKGQHIAAIPQITLPTGGTVADHRVLIWHNTSQKNLDSPPTAAEHPPGVHVHALAFAPTDGLLATGDDRGNLIVWRANEGGALIVVRRFQLPDSVEAVAFDAGGATLACAAGDRLIHLFSLPDGVEQRTFGSDRVVREMRFDLAGKYFAVIDSPEINPELSRNATAGRLYYLRDQDLKDAAAERLNSLAQPPTF